MGHCKPAFAFYGGILIALIMASSQMAQAKTSYNDLWSCYDSVARPDADECDSFSKKPIATDYQTCGGNLIFTDPVGIRAFGLQIPKPGGVTALTPAGAVSFPFPRSQLVPVVYKFSAGRPATDYYLRVEDHGRGKFSDLRTTLSTIGPSNNLRVQELPKGKPEDMVLSQDQAFENYLRKAGPEGLDDLLAKYKDKEQHSAKKGDAQKKFLAKVSACANVDFLKDKVAEVTRKSIAGNSGAAAPIAPKVNLESGGSKSSAL